MLGQRSCDVDWIFNGFAMITFEWKYSTIIQSEIFRTLKMYTEKYSDGMKIRLEFVSK